MSEAEYCEECHRIVGVFCQCGIPFSERVKNVNFAYDGWGPTSHPIQMPDNYPAGGRLSPHKPKGL